MDRAPLSHDRAIDTLAMARTRFPGSPASLDALCRRFNIDNSARELHGALLDSEILADVYLELIGGRQPTLVSAPTRRSASKTQVETGDWTPPKRPKPLKPRISEEEAAAHEAFVATLGEDALWRRFS